MIRTLTSVFLVSLLLMSSCTLVEPDVHYDWCYVYNFGVSDQGANLIAGTWVDEQGLTTDETGLLQVNWTHDRFVQPSIVLVKAVRPAGVTGDITVTANALVFGVNVAFTETLPSELNEVTLNFQPESSDQSGGTAVNAVLESSQPIAIQYLEVRGSFASPFDVNYCGQPSETVTATQVYTATPDTTNTPEPATNTPEPQAEFWWDGPYERSHLKEATSGGVSYPLGTSMGNHPASSEYFGIYTRYHDVAAHTPYHTSGGTTNTFDVRDLSSQTTVATMTINTYQGVLTVVNDSNAEHCSVRAARAGSGLPSPDENVVCDMITSTGVRVKTGNSAAVNGGARSDYGFTWSGTATGMYVETTIWYLYYGIPPEEEPTPTPTITPTPTRTPLPTVGPQSPTPSRTPFLFPTRATPDTPTPMPSTNTPAPPTSTRTPYPAPTPFITPTADPEGYDPNIENEAEWEILNQIGNVWNEIRNGAEDLADFTGRVADWANGSMKNAQTGIDNLGKEFAGFMEGFSNLITDVYQTGQLTIDMTRTLFNLSFGWFQDATTRINNIFGQFFNTPAKLIPGLPQCISNPTAYELCAIWWTLDWTLFAPNTPGDAIVPLLTIALNIGIVMYFVQMVLRLVRKVEVVANELAAE